MKSNKEIKKESIELVAKRPANFIIPSLLFVILEIIIASLRYDFNKTSNSFVSLLFSNTYFILFLLTAFINVGYCWFVINNRKQWHKKSMGSLESSVSSYNDLAPWTALGSLVIIWLIDFLFILLLANALISLYIYSSINESLEAIFLIVIVAFVILNVLLANFKYALLDQFTNDTPLSKKRQFTTVTWYSKFKNAIIISVKLMTNGQFLWQWIKLTFTTILWSCVSALLFQIPLIIIYPYTILCYINLYDTGVNYIKSSYATNEIPTLIFDNQSHKHTNISTFKELLYKCNNDSLLGLLTNVRTVKQTIIGLFTGPTTEDEQKAEDIIKQKHTNSLQVNKLDTVKSNINKQGLKRVEHIKQKQGKVRAKLNQPSTNPKSNNKKVMRKDHGR